MEKENLPEEPKTPADNLKFMRSVIEKTCRKIDPGWPIMIVWGLVFLIGFPVLYYLKMNQLDRWIWPIQGLLIMIGVGTTIYFGANASTS